MKRWLSAFFAIAFFCAAFILNACQQNTGEGKAFVYPITESPAALDPQIAAGTPAAVALANTMEGLVILGENGEILPGVAKSWGISPDGLDYTFTLRHDAQWFFSKENQSLFSEEELAFFDKRVTADQFVFALRRAVSPEIRSPFAQNLFAIENAQNIREGKADETSLGVTAPDAYTLCIRLAQPSADFLRILSTNAALPCHEQFYHKTQGRYGLSHATLLCNGPFFLYRWTRGENLSLRANPDYRSDRPVLPATLTLTPDADTRQYAAKLRNGSYSAAAMQDDGQSWEKGYTLTRKANAVLSLLFNCAEEPWSNTKLRLALAGTADRGLTEESVRAAGLIPPSCSAGQQSFRTQAGEAEFPSLTENAAKQTFQEALQELGKTQLSAAILCTVQQETLLRQIMQQWQRLFGLSLQISIQVLEDAELEQRVQAKDFNIAVTRISAKSETALEFLELFDSRNVDNPAVYRSATFDALCDTLRGVSTQEELLRGYRQAENHLLQNAVALPLENRDSIYALAKGVSGIYFQPDGEIIRFRSGIVLP